MKKSVIFVLSLITMSSYILGLDAYTKAQKIVKSEIKPISKKKIITKKYEVIFWAGQFVDHANYLSLMVKNKRDKEYGARLARQFANIKNEIELSRTLDRDLLSYYERLLRKLNHYLKVANNDVVVQTGSVTFSSLIKHMKEELDYHWRNLKGKNDLQQMNKDSGIIMIKKL